MSRAAASFPRSSLRSFLEKLAAIYYRLKNCFNLLLQFAKNITLIDIFAFSDCVNLTKLNIYSNKKLKVKNGAFVRIGIKSITLPKLNGNYIFAECQNLKCVSVPSNVNTIYKNQFFGCINLKTITIPPTVTKIGKYALGYFDDDTKISRIDNFTIKGVKDSAAEKYAKANKIKFVAIK